MATNTAASFTNHTGNGSAGPFNISFSYLAEAEVDVTVGGVLKTITTHYTFTSATQITFTSGNEPANGVAIKFQRDTNISAKKVDFTDGSVLTEADLDANSDQVLFAQQEITDKLGGIEEGATGDQTSAELKTLFQSDKLTANEINDNAITYAKIQNVSATDRVLGRDSGGAGEIEEITPANLRTMINVEDGATADQTITEIKSLIAGSPLDASHLAPSSVDTSELATDSVTTNEIADSELVTLAGMQSGTASKLADSTALTADLADLNQLDGMAKETTITDDDTKFPTSGAVVDNVAAQIAPIGGLEVIANEDSFPTTQPSSGVVISISDIEGLIVNGSGVATNARTTGNGSDNVTINGFPSSLQSKTMAAGLGLMVSSTGSSQTYTYHKLLAKEADVEQLSNDINDFAARYKVGSSNPTTDLDAGDLFFNTSTQKLLVYNSTNSAWEEAQSIGNFFISTFSESFDGSRTDFTVSNAPANAQQILLSINGVVQKPNSGTSTPSEGFALSGSTVKLAAAPASGSDYFAVVLGSTVNIGTPSNNTVTSAILQNGSVTTDKIGDDQVTAAKLASNCVVSDSIVDGSIVNADVNTSAAIAGSKISPDFGSQNIVTTGSITGNDLEIDAGTLSVDASNNRVGIGLSTPQVLLHLHGTNARLQLTDSSTGNGSGDGVIFGLNGDDDFFINNRRSSKHILFFTESVERVRIVNGGSVLFHQSNSSVPGYNNTFEGASFEKVSGSSLFVSRADLFCCHLNRNSNGTILQFAKSGNEKGSVSTDGNNVAYNTGASDRSLKKNFENWTEDTLNLFKNINPQKFNFLDQEDGTNKEKGFIAQDMVASFPEAYIKNDDDKYMFNPSGMVVYLMKALQEEIVKREALEKRVAALEAT